jgi:P4 family phage/plasmid primase-like protien
VACSAACVGVNTPSQITHLRLIKLLTGEDSVAARQLYAEQFNFLPQAKVWLRTNNRPEIRGTDNAIWRRVVALPFGQIVPTEKRDRFLREKLNAELAGIFAWMVAGYLDYARNGLVLAPVVQKAIEEYRKEQDIYERFFEAECEFGPDYSIGREALYLAFRGWCENPVNRVYVIPDIKRFKSELQAPRFRDRIAEKQKRVDTKQEWRWVGVDTKWNINWREKEKRKTQQG